MNPLPINQKNMQVLQPRIDLCGLNTPSPTSRQVVHTGGDRPLIQWLDEHKQLNSVYISYVTIYGLK